MIFFCFLLLHCGRVIGQPAITYSPAELHQDLDFLHQELKDKQANWEAYHTAESWAVPLANIKASINRPLNTLEWFQKLNYILAKAQEGHLNIGQASDVFYTGFSNGQFKVFPLVVRTVGKEVIVWTNLSEDKKLARGDQILRINGRSIREIRQQIFEHTLADGQIESSKQLFFQDEFAARYFWFVEKADSFVLEYLPFGKQQPQTVTINALTHLEMAAWMVKRQLPRPTRARGLEGLFSYQAKDKTAILTLRNFNNNAWAAYDKTPASFYAQVFKRLRKNKIQHLVIDVRGNKGGGKDFVDAFLPYLNLKPRQGTYRTLSYTNGYMVKSILPNRNPLYFKGQLYILTDGKTYSTAALLAQYAAQYAHAILIGSETGSRLEGFAAGGHDTVVLPHSGIEIHIPNAWVQNVLPTAPLFKNRGLLPHYPIEPTLEELLNEQDVALQKAWELINEALEKN